MLRNLPKVLQRLGGTAAILSRAPFDGRPPARPTAVAAASVGGSSGVSVEGRRGPLLGRERGRSRTWLLGDAVLASEADAGQSQEPGAGAGLGGEGWGLQLLSVHP